MAVYHEPNPETSGNYYRKKRSTPGPFMSRVLEKLEDVPRTLAHSDYYNPKLKGFDVTNFYSLPDAREFLAKPGALEDYLKTHPDVTETQSGRKVVSGKNILDMLQTVDTDGSKRRYLLNFAKGDTTKQVLYDSLEAKFGR